MAFNAKNLHYEKKIPAFLQRLQGHDSSEVRQRLQQRPRKKRQDREEDDNEPTYVDEESGEVVSKEEYERLVRGSEKDSETPVPVGEKEDEAEGAEREEGILGDEISSGQNVAEIGAGKKRKVGRVIGGHDEEEEEEEEKEERKSQNEGVRQAGQNNFKAMMAGKEKSMKAVSGKKKKKKVKLSFVEDE